ncbi:CIC11C00000000445 [Sungouiella intermedia]|uniref:CIC11C00000000445 n=1 Tax=Sungouiella intermedia TaxID=45354 RepID=A0A1L0BUZ3_9ASCO|nr:CIC11C00000000445 [[Candida] intermedia]
MKYLTQLMVRMRLHRRRSRHLAIVATVAASLLVLLFFLFSPHESTGGLVSNPEHDCGWLPSFFCSPVRWFSPKPVSERPVVPYKAVNSGSSSTPLPNPHQDKIDFIQSTYNGARAKRLLLGHAYYDKIMKVIVEAKPMCKKLEKYKDGHILAIRMEYPNSGNVFTEKYLSQYLQLDESELSLMVDSHKFAHDNLPDSYPEGLYRGDGIVYVGGGRFNWLALLSVRSLRAQGCQLPVEVFVPTLEEFELELCSRIFPVMNVRCVLLPTALFGENLPYSKQFKFLGYQYKSLAIMLSSFENVLLLDSDNVPTYSPDHLFTKEPFISTGLIVWPDFWHRTTSPDYYTIAGCLVSKTKLHPAYNERAGEFIERETTGDVDWENILFHDRLGTIPDPSSESGQLMISKKTHMRALLLALYYNMYGPGYYYPLFSQGAHGEGDKETFLAATISTNKPYYQVAKFLDALGNIKDGNFNGNGMGQYDPVMDYEWNLEKDKLRKKLSGQEYEDAVAKLTSPKILFVHANFPKLDPWKLFLDQDTVNEKGERYRLYGLGMKVRAGTDFEQDQWNYMYLLLCDLELKIEHFKSIDRKALCLEIKAHRDWLVSTEDSLEKTQ